METARHAFGLMYFAMDRVTGMGRLLLPTMIQASELAITSIYNSKCYGDLYLERNTERRRFDRSGRRWAIAPLCKDQSGVSTGPVLVDHVNRVGRGTTGKEDGQPIEPGYLREGFSVAFAFAVFRIRAAQDGVRFAPRGNRHRGLALLPVAGKE
jgi:hypothetical protein